MAIPLPPVCITHGCGAGHNLKTSLPGVQSETDGSAGAVVDAGHDAIASAVAVPRKHLKVYAFLDSLPTHHAYLAREAGVPVALLQTYEPGADPVGDCYDVLEGDLGAHFMMATTRPYCA